MGLRNVILQYKPYQWCVYWLLGLSEDLREGLKINKGPLLGYIDCLHLWLPVGTVANNVLYLVLDQSISRVDCVITWFRFCLYSPRPYACAIGLHCISSITPSSNMYLCVASIFTHCWNVMNADIILFQHTALNMLTHANVTAGLPSQRTRGGGY